jgi:hypothetical protein
MLLNCVLSSHTHSANPNDTALRTPGSLQPAIYNNDNVPFALDENLHDQSDMDVLYQQKLAVEGASPKPCIVPGNALQLIDDNPTASRSHTASSVIILDDGEGNRPEISLDSSAD